MDGSLNGIDFKALVIGYGSIGARHAQVLNEIGADVAIVSRRGNKIKGYQTFTSVKEGLKECQPSMVTICTETTDHQRCLREVLGQRFEGKVLVEKPVFGHYTEADGFMSHSNWYVSYNLRFHPLIKWLKVRLQTEKVLSMHLYVGSFLPDWRPGRDYSKVYSAHSQKGGGVLRDLSHEIDYAFWLTGPWKQLAALGGKISDLRISSDDCFNIIWETELGCQVSLHLDYLSRKPKRQILIVTQSGFCEVDLITGRLDGFGQEIVQNPERNEAFTMMYNDLNGSQESICSYEEGLEVVRFIDLVEEAAESKKWMQNQKSCVPSVLGVDQKEFQTRISD